MSKLILALALGSLLSPMPGLANKAKTKKVKRPAMTTFANQFIQFKMPQGWVCTLEKISWICAPPVKSKAHREAVLIFAAKVRGPKDNIKDYEKHLKARKRFTWTGGKKVVSRVMSLKRSNLHRLQWIDAVHDSSEVPGTITRYWATTKADIGVVVTFTVVRSQYRKYQKFMKSLMGSLRVFRKKLEELPSDEDSEGMESLFLNIGEATKKRAKYLLLDDEDEAQARKPQGDDDLGLYIILLGVMLGILYLKIRNRKKDEDEYR